MPREISAHASWKDKGKDRKSIGPNRPFRPNGELGEEMPSSDGCPKIRAWILDEAPGGHSGIFFAGTASLTLWLRRQGVEPSFSGA
jgi:hypothetical protein